MQNALKKYKVGRYNAKCIVQNGDKEKLEILLVNVTEDSSIGDVEQIVKQYFKNLIHIESLQRVRSW